jgi:hypothetical protein
MPVAASWNGQWSGAGKKHYHIRTINDNERKHKVSKLLNGDKSRAFSYNFGDGWVASVRMEIVTGPEAIIRKKTSAGFHSYEWMIDSILKHGEILAVH